MRSAAILGLGCSAKDLKPFQTDKTVEWRIGMPALGDQVDVILVFGGDGTVHRHLGQLVRLGVPVLVVPAGSGNDFARALGLPRVRDALAVWKAFCGSAGNVRAIDLGVISAPESAGGAPFDKLSAGSSTLAQGGSAPHGYRYFCCVGGVGLDGEVARRANQLPRWLRGHGGYVLSLAPTIFRFAPLAMKIFTTGEVTAIPQHAAELRSAGQPCSTGSARSEPALSLSKGQAQAAVAANAASEGWTTRSDQPTLLAAFANAPAYGGGMKIAPRAKMDDGLLDVCVVGGVDPFKLFCMFPTVYSGRHLRIREVSYFHATRIRVETERPLDVYADGEYVCQTPVEVTVQPAALKVVVPRGSAVNT
jgi:diacylglycerol kinase (ATP)